MSFVDSVEIRPTSPGDLNPNLSHFARVRRGDRFIAAILPGDDFGYPEGIARTLVRLRTLRRRVRDQRQARRLWPRLLQKITFQTHGKDTYGRTLGDVFLPDGTNVDQELVKQGWWWYRKYAAVDTVLEGLEKEAREAKKGLWVAPTQVPPWEWRKR